MTTWDPQTILGHDAENRVRFETSEVGLTVVDPIQRCRDPLAFVPDTAGVSRIDPDSLTAPVTAAVRTDADEIVLNRVTLTYVWDDDWTTLAHLEEDVDETFADGRYVLFLSGPIKLYVEVDGTVTVRADDETRLVFGDDATVTIGARSAHERPADVVTTTESPEDLMAAVSTFGSALKSTSPERSWPSMRGHPPAVELGDTLDVPAGLHPPDTGIWIEVPRDRQYVYVVAPLAYYLGAKVIPGPVPRIVTDDGFERRLDGPEGFEDEVERVLKQVVFVECLARNEGIYDFPLTERKAVEADLDREFGHLYHLDSAERLERILSIPYETLEPRVPDWELCTYVDLDPDWATVLPYVLDDLAIVKTMESIEAGSVDDVSNHVVQSQAEATASFFRSAGSEAESVAPDSVDDVVNLPDSSVLEQSWAGSGRPLGASKTVVDAYRNRLDREPTDGSIEVAIVCNDDRMIAEIDDVDNYGTDESIQFDVNLYRDLSTGALSTFLEHQGAELFHFIGHADEEGLYCSDGILDVAELESVSVDAFLLNACESYRQGVGLINGGAIGGFVTLQEIPNDAALDIGRLLARLLNSGYSLRAAINLVRDQYLLGDQYIIVGDGGYSVTYRQNPQMTAYEIDRIGEDRFELQMYSYGVRNGGVGTVGRPLLDQADYSLTLNESKTYEVSRSEMVETYGGLPVPVKFDGEWDWNKNLSWETI